METTEEKNEKDADLRIANLLLIMDGYAKRAKRGPVGGHWGFEQQPLDGKRTTKIQREKTDPVAVAVAVERVLREERAIPNPKID